MPKGTFMLKSKFTYPTATLSESLAKSYKDDIERETHGRYYVSLVKLQTTSDFNTEAIIHGYDQEHWLESLFPLSAIRRKMHLRQDLSKVHDITYDMGMNLSTSGFKVNPEKEADYITDTLRKTTSYDTDTIAIGVFSWILMGSLIGAGLYKYVPTLRKVPRRARRVSLELASRLNQVTTEAERESLLPRKKFKTLEEHFDAMQRSQIEREWQEELKAQKSQLEQVGGEFNDIPVGGNAESRLGRSGSQISKRLRNQKQQQPLQRDGGLQHTVRDLSKVRVWRRDYTCQLYETQDELKHRVMEYFRNSGQPTAVKYDSAVQFLKSEGWEFVDSQETKSKHPKLWHRDFPIPLDKTNFKQYYAQFYNRHRDETINLLRWATENGKKYGPR